MSLKVLYLRVNKHCNARCCMCDFWKNSEMEITEEQFEHVREKTGSIEMIRFTGGEPLLCKKLPKYIKKCHDQGIKTSVITNGLLLNEKLEELVESGLDQIIISIDGCTPEIHNKIRGVKGLLEKIEQVLNRIRIEYPSLHTRVNTVVSDRNLHNLPELALWLDEHHVEQWSIIPIKLSGYDWKSKMSLEDFQKGYRNFQTTVNNSRIKLLGYSSSWAGNVEDFWQGKSFIRPSGICRLTQSVTFYDPFTDHFYPCNCIPHRNKCFENQEEEIEWYYQNGHKYCNGCEPLNAYCSDFPETLNQDIFNF